MMPEPRYFNPAYKGSDKLKDKVVLISGGDSGIGRAVSILFAREGADVGFIYLDEHEDARQTQQYVKSEGQKCIAISGDIGNKAFCQNAVQKFVEEFGQIDVLINNAAVQYVQENLEDITEDQLEKTFRTNIYSYFFMTQAVMPHLRENGSIINTTSITAFRGKDVLIDYSSTKGAVLAFTRALSQNLAGRGIRVNAVAPGPIWTPLIPASFPEEDVAGFGEDTPLGRVGQPEEVAPCYVFLASNDASYITGQTIHPNGGEIVGG